MYLRTCGSLSPQINKKDCVRKLQIRQVPHLRKVRKCNKLFKSANLRICPICGTYLDRPPLEKTELAFLIEKVQIYKSN